MPVDFVRFWSALPKSSPPHIEALTRLDVRTGQEFAAAMYTLIGSAKLDGRDLEPYLRLVLARIADHPVSQIQDLPPWNLAHTLKAHSSKDARPPLS